MTDKTQSLPLLLNPPGKTDHQAVHCPKANFNHLVWYLFDPKVTESLGLSQDPSHSKCSALSHFSMSLVRKYVNLKKPYNEDVKE